MKEIIVSKIYSSASKFADWAKLICLFSKKMFFTADFMIFAFLKFPKLRYVH